MRLTVVFSDRTSCYAALYGPDAKRLFASSSATRHFCRALQLGREQPEAAAVFVGWVGDEAFAKGTLEVSRTFAKCIGLEEGEIVEASSINDAPIAEGVMVQPHTSDDWEVVELQASYIEEHLLEQIAVLTPGMVFPVWIHGSMPVTLNVDAADANQGQCFLLGRDSELMIESKQREAVKPVSVFGGASSKESAEDEEQRERGLQLRIFKFTADLNTPVGWINPHDVERLIGYMEADGCLAWLALPTPLAPDRDASSQHVGPVLLKIEPREDVPRRHIIIGTCIADNMQVPLFSFVRLWRCRQVPVYVPCIELLPLGPCEWRRDSAEDARWLSRLLERLVDDKGEIDIMDGAIMQLQDFHVPKGDIDAKEAFSLTADPVAEVGTSTRTLSAAGSELTDLYDGLSDIDDIYGSSLPTCEVIGNGQGIYELDLGLDDMEDDFSVMRLDPTAPASLSEIVAAERPATVDVCIRFELGVARLGGSKMPPFLRVTARSFIENLKVTVAWPPEKHSQASISTTTAKQSLEPLTALWRSTPALGNFPEEPWSEVLQLLPGLSPQTHLALDELNIFSGPSGQLRSQLLAQLGCTPQCRLPEKDNANDTEAAPVPCPTSPLVHTGVVPGAAAVLGPRGTGKTLLCRRVCAGLVDEGVLCLEVLCGKLGQPARKFKAVQDWLQGIIRFASWHSPAVVFFDDFGALCPDVEQGAQNLSITEERSVILAEILLDTIQEVRACGARVALVASMPDDSAVHRTLWRATALEGKIALRPPLMKERPEILQTLCNQKACVGWEVDAGLLVTGALDDWGGRVDGFSVADLCMLVEKACLEATVESSTGLIQGSDKSRWGDRPRLALRHLERAVTGFVAATMADQTFFTSEVCWSDIGGLDGPKQALLDMLTTPTKYGVLVDRAPVRTRKGLMLVGPPGCGKTMLVQAAANETKGLLRFLTVKGPELLSKYIGESEAGVRKKFEQAAAAAPCVIFFDEIEALAPKRGADSTGVTDRVVNQMLCYLDGVEDRGRVYVVAASSRPDMVDQALMRPGRFDKICYCGLPTDEEKVQICETLAAKHGLVIGPSEQQPASTELRPHLQRLASRFPRLFTSADIGAIFSTAKVDAVTSAQQDAEKTMSAVRSPILTMAHLYEALPAAKASVSEADDQRYSKIFAPYQPGARPNALKRDGTEMAAATKVALA